MELHDMRSFAEKKSTSRPSLRRAESPIVEWLSRLTDAAVLGVIFVAPLFMGGRGPVGKFVIIAFVGLAAVAWSIRQCLTAATWRWSGVEILILLGGLLAVVQLLPLPQSALYGLSPILSEWLPLWQPDSPVSLGKWSTISLSPEDTRGGLAMYLAYTTFFLILIQRIETQRDVQWLVKSLALAAIGMASLGMVQFLCGNGQFLWVYHHPSRDTFDKVNGTFQNQNHFAHFLALGIGPIIFWLHQRWSMPARKPHFSQSSRSNQSAANPLLKNLLAIGAGIVIVASLLTFSRGGVICVALVSVTTVLIYWKKSLLGKKSLIGIGVFVAIVGIAVAIYGHQQLSRRMTTIVSGSLEEIAPVRIELWKAQWKAIPQFPWFGTGVGSHRDVYRIFLDRHYDMEFTHGENGYFELLLETGFAGLGLLLFGFVCSLRWCWTVIRSDSAAQTDIALAGALVPGLIASLAQSTGDFVWYISSCVTSTLVIVACACRLFQLTRAPDIESGAEEVESSRVVVAPGQIPLSRLAAIGLMVVVLVGSFVCLKSRLGPALASAHWDDYRRAKTISKDRSQATSQRDQLSVMEAALERVLYYDQNDARADFLLGSIQLKRFEFEQKYAMNPMALDQICDAAFESRFSSKQAQQAWLDRAFGENAKRMYSALAHCRRALRAVPLQGEIYAYLAQLSFLEDPRRSTIRHYVDQAYRVRPYSGIVLLTVGKEAALAGDPAKAMEHWRRAFQFDPEVRDQLIESLARSIPPDAFMTYFQPDHQGLFTLYTYYLDHQQIEEAKLVGPPLTKLLVTEATTAANKEAVQLWGQARDVQQFLGDLPGALECQRHAVDLRPADFDARRILAKLYMQNGRHSDAAAELEWCLRRHPEDATLKEELASVRNQNMETARSAKLPAASSTKSY